MRNPQTKFINIRPNGRPLVKVMASGAPASGETQRLGFMAVRIQVPEDFDQMGAGEIEDLFAGPTE